MTHVTFPAFTLLLLLSEKLLEVVRVKSVSRQGVGNKAFHHQNNSSEDVLETTASDSKTHFFNR